MDYGKKTIYKAFSPKMPSFSIFMYSLLPRDSIVSGCSRNCRIETNRFMQVQNDESSFLEI